MAKQIRKMPTKGVVRSHWAAMGMFDPPDRDDLCWGCGFDACTHRCHILAKCHGGTDDAANLVLLCQRCHLTQEHECQTQEGRKAFVDSMMDGAPYMTSEFYRRMHTPEFKRKMAAANLSGGVMS